MATKNTLQVVLDILGTAPNSDIKGEIWVEIFKLQLALKGLASAIDSLRAKAALISAGQAVTYQTIGDVTYALYLQDLTKVNVRAGSRILANTAISFRSDGGGGIVADHTYQSAGHYIDAYSVNEVSAGAVGEFILKGLISYYTPGNSHTYDGELSGDGSSNNEEYLQAAASHHRLALKYYFPPDYNPHPYGLLAYYTAWFYGYAFGKKKYFGPTGSYAGARIGTIRAYSHAAGGILLAYFNPERR